MAFPLLTRHLLSQPVATLEQCRRSLFLPPSPHARKKADLIALVIEFCSSDEVHLEAAWRQICLGETVVTLKTLLNNFPHAGLPSTWGRAKKDLEATIIRLDKRSAVGAGPALGASSTSASAAPSSAPSPVCTTLVLDHACKWKEQMRRTAKRWLKRKQRSKSAKQALREIVRANPQATVQDIQRLLEQETGVSFEQGSKHYAFFHRQLFKICSQWKVKRAAPRIRKFSFGVVAEKPARAKRRAPRRPVSGCRP